MKTKTIAALVIAAAAAAPLVAGAAPNGYERRLVGRVVTFAPYNLQLDRGPHIYLHDGTVLRPRGLTPQNGMHVSVLGHTDGNGSFQADEIDLMRRPLPPPPFRRF